MRDLFGQYASTFMRVISVVYAVLILHDHILLTVSNTVFVKRAMICERHVPFITLESSAAVRCSHDACLFVVN